MRAWEWVAKSIVVDLRQTTLPVIQQTGHRPQQEMPADTYKANRRVNAGLRSGKGVQPELGSQT